jgi:hypothetical protein
LQYRWSLAIAISSNHAIAAILAITAILAIAAFLAIADTLAIAATLAKKNLNPNTQLYTAKYLRK